MPRRSHADAKKDVDKEKRTHSFWSGTIAFGLVSLPVSLYPANRPSAVSLRMLDEDGTPLARRFFCSRDAQPLSGEDLVRGFEIARKKYIEVTDEELESLAPDKSREIDLRRFVPLDEIDPMFFERAYFLIPEEGASKAYRLLARSMESMGRAGIATFVMRGKEYLIAIIAEKGVVRAETMRFYDELRTPADVGLPELNDVSAEDVRVIKQQIAKMASDELDRDELADEASHRLLDLVERKLESGRDVVHAPEIAAEEEGAEIIDLMQVLTQRLAANARTESEPPGKSAIQAEPTKKKEPKTKKSEQLGHRGARKKPEPEEIPDSDSETTKAELYDLAKELNVQGRSHMSKQELLRAIQSARG